MYYNITICLKYMYNYYVLVKILFFKKETRISFLWKKTAVMTVVLPKRWSLVGGLVGGPSSGDLDSSCDVHAEKNFGTHGMQR